MKIAIALKQGVLALCVPSRFSFTASHRLQNSWRTKARHEIDCHDKELNLSRLWIGSVLHRSFASVAVFCGILLLLTAPALAQRRAVSPVAMPPCSPTGGPNGGYGSTADLSTTSTAVSGATDPHWTVNSHLAYHLLTPAQIPGAWNPGTNWLQPNVAPLPDSGASAGYYTYQIQFDIPQCVDTSDLVLTGEYWADNWVTSFQVNSFIGPTCMPANDDCFAIGHGTAFTIPASALVPLPAHNTMTIIVYNFGSWTGLSVNATLTGDCSGSGVNGTTNQCGNLKVCKVAGPGVASGTPFTFNYTSAHASGSASIPAGPAPGGFCKLSTSVPDGTFVNLAEILPAGDIVSSIDAEPPGRLVNSNLGAGTSRVRIGPGVTEVTYTDENQKEETGYLEICKQYTGQTTTAPPQFATFNITPGSAGPVVVPVGACSPALEVPAGTVTIIEVPIAGSMMASCSTIPASDQVSCVPATWTDTVTVAAGNIPNQTIAFITNSPANSTGCTGTTTGFTLTASPSAVTVNQGSTATSTITVTPCGPVAVSATLSASGLPAGVTASFSPNPTTGTSVVTFTASTSATLGAFTVTITGTSGPDTASTPIALTVN
jgi:hypothetical protein